MRRITLLGLGATALLVLPCAPTVVASEPPVPQIRLASLDTTPAPITSGVREPYRAEVWTSTTTRLLPAASSVAAPGRVPLPAAACLWLRPLGLSAPAYAYKQSAASSRKSKGAAPTAVYNNCLAR